MDVSRLRVDQLRERVDICGEQFLVAAIVENLLHNHVLTLQRLQYLFRSDVLARLCLLGLLYYLQAVEQHLTYLLRRRDIELHTCQFVHFALYVVHLCRELL